MCVLLPAFQLGQKYLEPVGRQVLSKYSIVPAMKGNAVVPNLCRNIDSTIQMAVLLIVVQLVLIGHAYLHSGSSFPKLVHLFYNHYSIQRLMCKELFSDIKTQNDTSYTM
jgi:hypothetical protein